MTPDPVSRTIRTVKEGTSSGNGLCLFERWMQPLRMAGITCTTLGSTSLCFLFLVSACQPKQANQQQVPDNMPDIHDSAASTSDASKKYVLFLGNSLTAGYGVDEAEAFPHLIQKRIDSLGLAYNVINAGVSGETTAGGLARTEWVLQQPVDVFVLALGANDALRGFDLQATRRNLNAIVEKVRELKPEASIIIAGMLAPPNMGPRYTEEFNSIFPELAKEHDAALIPFLLEGVAARPGLNQEDGIHPNAEGHQIVMENVWAVLKNQL